jgi:hypothetical protein
MSAVPSSCFDLRETCVRTILEAKFMSYSIALAPTMERHSIHAYDEEEPPPPFTIPFHLLPSTPTKRKNRGSFSPRKHSSKQPRTSDPFPNPSPSQTKSSHDRSEDRGYKNHDPFDPFTLWDESRKSYRRRHKLNKRLFIFSYWSHFQISVLYL